MNRGWIALKAVLQGDTAPDSALLQNARLEGLGASAFGEESIMASLRRAGLSLSAGTDVIESERSLAAFDGSVGLYADLYEGRIARLWCLGARRLPRVIVPAISVPFDPDLAQARGAYAFAASDHPELAPRDVEHVAGLAGELAAAHGLPRDAATLDDATSDGPPDRASDISQMPHAWPPAWRGADVQSGHDERQGIACRTRVFVRRAFSCAPRGAALFAVTTWSDEDRRVIASFNVACAFRTAGGAMVHYHYVVDHAGASVSRATPWKPRV